MPFSPSLEEMCETLDKVRDTVEPAHLMNWPSFSQVNRQPCHLQPSSRLSRKLASASWSYSCFSKSLAKSLAGVTNPASCSVLSHLSDSRGATGVPGWLDWLRVGRLGQLHRQSAEGLRERAGRSLDSGENEDMSPQNQG